MKKKKIIKKFSVPAVRWDWAVKLVDQDEAKVLNKKPGWLYVGKYKEKFLFAFRRPLELAPPDDKLWCKSPELKRKIDSIWESRRQIQEEPQKEIEVDELDKLASE